MNRVFYQNSRICQPQSVFAVNFGLEVGGQWAYYLKLVE